MTEGIGRWASKRHRSPQSSAASSTRWCCHGLSSQSQVMSTYYSSPRAQGRAAHTRIASLGWLPWGELALSHRTSNPQPQSHHSRHPLAGLSTPTSPLRSSSLSDLSSALASPSPVTGESQGTQLPPWRFSWLPNTVGLVSYLEKQPRVSSEDAFGVATPLQRARDQL